MRNVKKVAIWALIILVVMFSPILFILGSVASSIIVTVLTGLLIIALPIMVIALIGYFFGKNKR